MSKIFLNPRRSDSNARATVNRKSSWKLKPTRKPKLVDFVDKTYELVRSTRYERFLAEIGADETVIRAAARLRPTVELTRNKDDSYTLTTTYPEHSKSRITFRMGVSTERERPDGRSSWSTFEEQGNKLIERQTVDGKEVTVKRKFTANELVVTMETNGVKCHRFYKTIEPKTSIGTETSRRSYLYRPEDEYKVANSPPVESVIEEVADSDSENEACI